jgi:hypothetical protein
MLERWSNISPLSSQLDVVWGLHVTSLCVMGAVTLAMTSRTHLVFPLTIYERASKVSYFHRIILFLINIDDLRRAGSVGVIRSYRRQLCPAILILTQATLRRPVAV